MKKRITWNMGLALAVFVLSAACRHRDGEGFVTALLPADSLTAAHLSGYTSWARCGDKVVTYSLPSDPSFSAYRLPDFEYLYSFDVLTPRPGRYYAAGIFPAGAEARELSVIGLSERTLYRLKVGEDSARVVQRYPGAEKVVYVNGTMVSDSLAIVGTMNFLEKSHRVTLLDVRQWDTLGRIESKTLLDAAFNAVNYPVFAVSQNGVALVYKSYKRIEYYRQTPDGTLEFVKAVGGQYDRDDVARMKADAAPLDGPVDVAWDERYLYLLENAVNRNGKIQASRIEMFDWQGRGRYRLRLERPATKILPDARRGKLYALRPNLDSSRVYVYDIRAFAD